MRILPPCLHSSIPRQVSTLRDAMHRTTRRPNPQAHVGPLLRVLFSMHPPVGTQMFRTLAGSTTRSGCRVLKRGSSVRMLMARVAEASVMRTGIQSVVAARRTDGRLAREAPDDLMLATRGSQVE